MEYLQNESTTVRLNVNYPKLRVHANGASLNVLAQALLKDEQIGAKFCKDFNHNWYVQFVTNAANRDTFWITKSGTNVNINGIAIGKGLEHWDYELVGENGEYQLVPVN